MSATELRSVIDGETPGELGPRERLAVEYAERITRTGEDVDDELYSRVRAEFSNAEIVELTATVALENLLSKFHRTLRVEAHGFCRLDDR